MRFSLLKFLALTTMLIVGMGSVRADDTPQCEVNRPVRFGAMSWETNRILVSIERFILAKGYGCATRTLPLQTLPALAALERGDLDINSEVWINSMTSPWEDAQRSGKVKYLGELYAGSEGWYIPRYTAARLPELKEARDLPSYAVRFMDPDDLGKGRFYGCPPGWACAITNANLFHALKLGQNFNLYSPRNGVIQKAELLAAYRRKQNIVFYYWGPTPLLSQMDVVKLQLPSYDEAKHRCLTQPECPNPQPSAFPDTPVFTAVNTDFARQAPQLVQFLSAIKMSPPVLAATLDHMEKLGGKNDNADKTAIWFLKHETQVWTAWVPSVVAKRVTAAL